MPFFPAEWDTDCFVSGSFANVLRYMDSINPGEDPKPNYGLDLRPDELATHGFTQAQETFLGYITGTGYHTCPIYEVNEGVVKLISPGFTQTKETFRDFACSYPSPSYGLNVELGISMRKATLKDFGDYSSVPNHKLDVSLVKPTSPGFAQTQETSLGNTAGYYLSPSYGLDLDLVKPTQKVIFDHLGDYPTLPSHELDVGPVKPVNDAFAWIQKVIFKNIRDYPSIPRYELNVGLVKPVTNAFAWIERGIDAIDNIVSLIHRGYKEGSAIVGVEAIASENPLLFLIDPTDTVLSKLLAAIDIVKNLFTKSIDNCFDVKTKAHGGLTLL